MPTPAQPAPVTPPPEWAVELHGRISDWMLYRKEPIGVLLTDIQKTLARHAPPPAPSDALTASEWSRLRDWFGNPQRKWSNLAFTAGAARDAASAFESSLTVADSAPSCPTEQGELVKRLKQAEKNCRRGEFNASATAIGDAIKALSRQPAPSAVAKDRAEVVEKLKHWHVLWSNEHRGMEALPDIADAIALLSQPAVAQTEAGNDMTTAESVEVIIRKDESAYVAVGPIYDLSKRSAACDLDLPLWAIHALRSALSSRKPLSASPSVPAVAGGGEDGDKRHSDQSEIAQHLNYMDAVIQTCQLNGGDGNRVNLPAVRETIVRLRQLLIKPAIAANGKEAK